MSLIKKTVLFSLNKFLLKIKKDKILVNLKLDFFG